MRRIVLKAVTAFAGLLFLVSVFFPFLGFESFSGIPEIMSITGECWSFKITYKEVDLGHSIFTITYWFGDYWRQAGYAGFEPLILFIMLAAQILTVLSAGFAAFKTRPFSVLLPAVFSTVTVLCMWFFSQAKTVRMIHITGFELGFWLALASATLFLAIFMISLLWTWKEHRVSP